MVELPNYGERSGEGAVVKGAERARAIEVVRVLSEDLVRAQLAQKSAERAASEAKEQVRLLELDELPRAMDAAAMPAATFSDLGYSVAVDDFARANIAAEWPDEEKAAGYDLLEKEGHGSIVKREIVLQFGRDEEHLVRYALALLHAGPMPDRVTEGMALIVGTRVAVRNAVPWNTLTKLVKELHAEGKLTMDMRKAWGAYVGKKATVRALAK